MKVNDLQNAQVTGNTPKTVKNDSDGSGFQKILESKQNMLTQPALEGSTLQNASAAIPAAIRIESLQLSEKTINTLESFGSALGNSKFAGEDLEPFVEALEDESRSILELKKQIPMQDPLSDLLDRVATVSYVEAAKYRRGDYQ